MTKDAAGGDDVTAAHDLMPAPDVATANDGADVPTSAGDGSGSPLREHTTMRFREGRAEILALPWTEDLDAWSDEDIEFVDLPVGASRHTVRFLVVDDGIIALKELPLGPARREYEVMRELEARGAPAVRSFGLVERRDDDSAIIATRYLARSFQFRRLFMRLPEGELRYRDQLLDAMTSLLVELHRLGLFWGDCSLANTLLLRDGQTLQAYLVDAETSEIHPQLSDGQRQADLDIAIENVAGDLADLALMRGRSLEEIDEDLAAAASLRERYTALWSALHDDIVIGEDQRFRVDARLRALHELGYAVDEVVLEPGERGSDSLRLHVAVAGRDYHSARLRRLTGLDAGEGQSAILLNDMTAWAGMGWAGTWDAKEGEAGRSLARHDGARWTLEVFEPTVKGLLEVSGPQIDPVQAYCDLLEVRWLLSERAGHDVGTAAALESIGSEQLPDGSAASLARAEEPAPQRRLGWSRP